MTAVYTATTDRDLQVDTHVAVGQVSNPTEILIRKRAMTTHRFPQHALLRRRSGKMWTLVSTGTAKPCTGVETSGSDTRSLVVNKFAYVTYANFFR